MPIKKAKVEAKPSNEATYDNAERYLEIQAEIKGLTAEADVIKSGLKKQVTDAGVVVPDSGSYHLEVTVKGKQTIYLTNVCRTSIKPKADAVEIVETKFEHLASQLVEDVPMFREDRLEVMLEQGEITKEDAEKLLTISTSYAFNCKLGKE